MRGRSTVGRGALNALMLVRFQPPQLTEVIRLDEETVLKTVGFASRAATWGFESLDFRSPIDGPVV